jgi:hypothetical protein
MQTLTQRLANPTRFMDLSGRLLPWVAATGAVWIGYAMYLVFFVAPPDYQQGETVKIMYVHVPSAWLAMMAYALIAIRALGSSSSAIPSPTSRPRPLPRSAPHSRSPHSSRARSGASRCGAPTGFGTRA